MKILCSTQEFLSALQLVSRAIGSQQALPILGNILLEAKGDKCIASATDLELSIVTSFDARIESEGSITVPAKAILNFAQYNTDAEVMLEAVEGTQLRCTSKHAKTLIAGEAASEYPSIAGIEKQTTFSLEASPLLQALHLVTFAAARTTLRPVLSGVYLRSMDGMLVLVATDSYRLSEYRLPTEGGSEQIACIIPVKILDEVRMVLGASAKSDKKAKKEETTPENTASGHRVAVSLSKQQIELRVGDTRLLSRLIDGKFPNYEQIIPKDETVKVHLSLDELTTAVKRMHYFAKEMNNNLTFHFAAGQSKISTPQTPIGKDEAELQAEITGGEGKIALSSSYLLDFLGHMTGEGINLTMTDSQHPAVFRIPGEERFLHLIMPLRMQE